MRNHQDESTASTDETPAATIEHSAFWLTPLLCLLLAAASIALLDYRVGMQFSKVPLDGPLERLLDAAEHFGTPFGQILILFAVGALHHYWEPRIVRIFAAACSAGLAADVVKLLVSRYRPQAFDFQSGDAWATFLGWFPLGAGGSDAQSFPSAHTASAVGFALAMAWAFPRARRVFWGLAALVGLHRVAAGAHFPSDVLAGSAVGWLVGYWFVNPSPICRAFDRWELIWASWNPWRRERSESRQGLLPSELGSRLLNSTPTAEKRSSAGMEGLTSTAVIACTAAVVFLTGLGVPGLWDEDEGFFVSAAAEMHRRNDWIVPTFNGELFAHKPPFMYWMMRLGFWLCGVNEWGARLFSALCGIASAVLTQQLGRRLFSARAGFLAGLAVTGAVMFAVVSRAATPDGFLVFFILLSIYFYVRSVPGLWEGPTEGGRPPTVSECLPRRWIDFACIYGAMGVGVLVKGPIAILLPGATIGLFVILLGAQPSESWRRLLLLWGRQLGSLRPLRTFIAMRPWTALLVTLLIAGPWFAAVGVATEGAFHREFFGVHHFGRFAEPMENHSGSILYYPFTALVGFFPWSIFWIPVAGSLIATQRARTSPGRPELLLICWMLVVVGLFSLAGTKLPNYILPAYPAFALASGRWLDGWLQRPQSVWSGWPRLAYGSLAVVGLGIIAAMPVLGGVSLGGRPLYQLAGINPALMSESVPISLVGLIPLLGGAAALWFVARGRPRRSIATFAASSAVFTTVLLGGVGIRLGQYQTSRPLMSLANDPSTAAGSAGTRSPTGAYGCFDPSMVFYRQGEVNALPEVDDVVRFFLNHPDAQVVVTDRSYEGLIEHTSMEFAVVHERPRFPKPGRLLLIRRSPHSEAVAESGAGAPLR